MDNLPIRSTLDPKTPPLETATSEALRRRPVAAIRIPLPPLPPEMTSEQLLSALKRRP